MSNEEKMREHIYKAKRRDNHEWIIGYYCKYGDNHCIIEPTKFGIAKGVGIIPETLGQYTGLTDKNGKRIFEGDIVKATGTNDHIGYVTFEYGKFITRCTCHPKSVCDIHPPIEEVIGNIHDNGELLTAERSKNAK